MYVLLTGNLPFDDHHVGRLLAKIKIGRFKPLPDWVSHSAKDLIYRMLIVDPNKRISVGLRTHVHIVYMTDLPSFSSSSSLTMFSYTLGCSPAIWVTLHLQCIRFHFRTIILGTTKSLDHPFYYSQLIWMVLQEKL